MTEPWANNILSFEAEVDPAQLLAHPLNARRHPGAQREALRGMLQRVGWVDVVKVNQRTGHVVDGHARVEEAISAGATVPVLYLDLSEEDEKAALAGLDRITGFATWDDEVLADLLSGMEDLEGSTWDEGDLEDLLKLVTTGPTAIGMLGNSGLADHPTTVDRLDAYIANGVRSVIIDLDLETFRWWADLAPGVREELGVQTTSEMVVELFALHTGQRPPAASGE